MSNFIDSYLKSNKIKYLVDSSDSAYFYELNIGSFPMYIQYEIQDETSTNEALQIWAKEDEDSYLDLFHNSIDSDIKLTNLDIEQVIEESIEEYKSILKAVFKIDKNMDIIMNIAQEINLSVNVLSILINDRLDNYE
jgi:hypothetical protein